MKYPILIYFVKIRSMFLHFYMLSYSVKFVQGMYFLLYFCTTYMYAVCTRYDVKILVRRNSFTGSGVKVVDYM